jgi:integral membrane sensor domain MASE1
VLPFTYLTVSSLIFGATSIPTFSGPSAGCSFMAFFGLVRTRGASPPHQPLILFIGHPHVLIMHILLHRTQSAVRIDVVFPLTQ